MLGTIVIFIFMIFIIIGIGVGIFDIYKKTRSMLTRKKPLLFIPLLGLLLIYGLTALLFSWFAKDLNKEYNFSLQAESLQSKEELIELSKKRNDQRGVVIIAGVEDTICNKLYDLDVSEEELIKDHNINCNDTYIKKFTSENEELILELINQEK